MLHLPAELRNKIYAYASDTVRIVSLRGSQSQLQVSHSGTVLNSIYTQTRSEASSFVQSPRVLCIDGFKVVRLGRMKLTNTTSIRTIQLPMMVAEDLFHLIDLRCRFGMLGGFLAWEDVRRLAGLFPGLRYVVIMRDEAGTEQVVSKSDIDTETQKGLLMALETIFDKRDKLEMVLRD